MVDKKVLREKTVYVLQRLQVLFAGHKVSIGAWMVYAVLDAAVYVWLYDLHLILPFEEDFVFCFLKLFCLAALFSEICFPEQRLWRRCGFFMGAVFSGAGAFFLELTGKDTVLGLSGTLWRARAEEAVLGIVLLLLIGIVYCSFRKTALSFAEYMLKLAVQLLKVFSLWLILTLGVGMVSLIIDSLFLNGAFSIVTVSVDLVQGVLAPGVILALRPPKEEPGYFLQVLVQYVFGILSICALLVVYVYLLRILITRELPSNEIFPILAALFCLGMPVWMASGCWKGGNGYVRRLEWLPYVFGPLVGMQILAAGIRIRANGLTPDRYAAVMLIVFEIGTLLLWHFQRDRMERTLFLLGALLVLTFLVPGVNRYGLSVSWQQAWLERYYEKVEEGGQLSSREYERLKGAYKYLTEEIPAYRGAGAYDIESEEFKEKLALQDPVEMELTRYERYSVHGCQLVDGLDVDGFSRMDMLDKANGYGGAKERESVDFSRFRLEVRETGEVLEVDLDDFAERCMEYAESHETVSEEEWRGYMQGFNRIPVGEDQVLCLTHFQVSYCKGLMDGADYFEWSSIGTVSGMLLQR